MTNPPLCFLLRQKMQAIARFWRLPSKVLTLPPTIAVGNGAWHAGTKKRRPGQTPQPPLRLSHYQISQADKHAKERAHGEKPPKNRDFKH
jgi:hypothetical protein